jgi:hypothetical protein
VPSRDGVADALNLFVHRCRFVAGRCSSLARPASAVQMN